MKYYQHITQLPLSRFIDALVDGNIQALVIEGDVEEELLIKAWVDIQQDYAEAIGDNEYRLYLSVLKEVFTLGVKVDIVYRFVTTLRKFYVKEFAKQLNQLLKTSYSFDYNKPEIYEQQLNGCLTRIKGTEITLAKKKAQMNAMQAKMETGEKPSREYFSNMMIALSNDAGYELNEETITVYKYVQRIKLLNKKLKAK